MAEEQKDLNKGDKTSTEDDHSGTEGGDEKSKDEEIAQLKSDLEKSNKDRDNYKEGLLRRKVEDRDLEKKEEEKEGEEKKEVDEEKIKKETATAVFSEIEKSNEKRAKENFLKRHPEYIDDAKWNDFITDFSVKRGKATTDDILDDMEDAALLHKRRSGGLDEYLKSERERGKREGEAEANIRGAGDAGGVGDQGGGEQKSKRFETEKGDEIAKGMKVDPEKAKDVDTSDTNSMSIQNP